MMFCLHTAPLGLVAAACTTAAAQTTEQREILEAHNRDRAKHCAKPLTWSKELATEAEHWAAHLRKLGCKTLQHSDTKHGENLAAGTLGYLHPQKVVDGWYAEISQYDYKKHTFSEEAGHFTQLVWADTQRLGCATARCSDFEVWVCEYDPPGNVYGKFEKNVRKPTCGKSTD